MIWYILAGVGAGLLLGILLHAFTSWIGKLPEDY